MGDGNVKRVAKNTVIMYIRMIVLMCISFVTSRLFLQALGVEDYGIYSIVGSVTSTFVALKSLFSESVQRFLNFYKGKQDINTQKDVFTISLLIHAALAVIFVILLEIIGLWLINNKLVYPIEKYDAVIFVFQMTVISSVLSILCIPFDAVIIANERMGFFAFLSIFDGVLRLLVVLLLPILPFPALKTYAFLIIFIPLSSLVISSIYSRRFEECKLSKTINKGIYKDILSLSGWNFFGNISFSILHEGINFILNIFGGLVYNAARSIAYQVKSIAVQFSTNSLIAARPMVMQSAAVDNENKALFRNIIEISRIAFFIMLIPTIPIIVYCPELLNIWLTIIPDNTTLFTRLVVLGVLFRSLHEPLNMLYMSVGKIKRMMIIEVIVMITAIFIIYIVLSQGAPMWVAFALLAIMEIVIVLCLLINARRELRFPLLEYIKQVILPFISLLLISTLVAFLFSFIKTDLIVLLLVLCVALITVTVCTIIPFMNEQEKRIVKNFIASKKSKYNSNNINDNKNESTDYL